MFCEMNAEELTWMKCLFLLFPMETFFLWIIDRWCYLLLSLLAECLSHSFLSFLQNYILGLFFFWDIPLVALPLNPRGRRFLKLKCGIDVWPHHIFSGAALFCPSLIFSAARSASQTWACTYHFTSSFFIFLIFFSFNRLHSIKYNAFKLFLILNNGMLSFISLHL